MERRSLRAPLLLRRLLLLLLLAASAAPRARAQYEKYSFRGFPEAELMPLQSAYSYALEQYEGESWKESIRYLEASLRLHRLLRDSEAHCHKACAHGHEALGEPAEVGARSASAREPAGPGGALGQSAKRPGDLLGEPAGGAAEEWLREMELFELVLQRASCLRRCKRGLPAFRLSYPPAETLRNFQRRLPYQYLHYALFKTNKIEKAVSAAHTFLQKNPKHEMTQKYLNYYKTMVDVDEYLIDLEAQPYETVFVRAVKLYNSGDFRSSIADMEHALSEYYKAYENCFAGCEGSYELLEFKDFYPAIADHFLDVLQCKVDCEAELTPNVGGYFVEKFVATMYHYLQFAYYKLNDIKNAVRSVASYMLFDPRDEVMQQNLAYYRFHRERWHLEENDFNPRPEYSDNVGSQKADWNSYARPGSAARLSLKEKAALEGTGREPLSGIGPYSSGSGGGAELSLPCSPASPQTAEFREALHYHNRTSAQKKLLEFARLYLQPDDEGEVGDGEEAADPQYPSDAEFEGIGDYEEGFLSQWWQEPRTKGDKADQERLE